jgi:gluconate kinase
MPATLLDSQLATLEAGDDMLRVPVSAVNDEATAVSKVLQALQARSA